MNPANVADSAVNYNRSQDLEKEASAPMCGPQYWPRTD